MHLDLQWNWVLLLAISRYIGDHYVIQSLALLPISGHFTSLRADDAKNQQLHRLSVGPSLGFARERVEVVL